MVEYDCDDFNKVVVLWTACINHRTLSCRQISNSKTLNNHKVNVAKMGFRKSQGQQQSQMALEQDPMLEQEQV